MSDPSLKNCVSPKSDSKNIDTSTLQIAASSYLTPKQRLMGIPVTSDFSTIDNIVDFCEFFCRQLNIPCGAILQSTLGMSERM